MKPEMEVKIDLFGVTKEIIGQSAICYTLSAPANVQALLDKLKVDFPRLQALSSLAVAVNSEYADNEQELQENDEIALIPPVSGG